VTVVAAAEARPPATLDGLGGSRPAIAVDGVMRRFGSKIALEHVDLEVEPGEIRALLGPNGAGKTTLLRILAGLMEPSAGAVWLLGERVAGSRRGLRRQIGLVPAGDRSFYLRLSGIENLAFFARLHGMSRRQATARGRDVLEWVGLGDAGRGRVGEYSHGMQKRLSMARALLTEPAVLLVDEATHDLDPEGALRIRALVADAAARGTAVIWATQRLDEIRGFAHTATVLRQGTARFGGTVDELMAHAVPRRYVVRLAGRGGGAAPDSALQAALGEQATISALDADGHRLLALAPNAVLGDALVALSGVASVLSCRNERPEVEEAFFSLLGDGGR
jgi:ABC-2 type transport system ATP-binding protein